MPSDARTHTCPRHAGLLSIKHVTPDGPASQTSEVQKGDFLVAIDGLTTLGMPMHQVSLCYTRRASANAKTYTLLHAVLCVCV
jgi:C-terminal processing protease CtpA/Prc